MLKQAAEGKGGALAEAFGAGRGMPLAQKLSLLNVFFFPERKEPYVFQCAFPDPIFIILVKEAGPTTGKTLCEGRKT